MNFSYLASPSDYFQKVSLVTRPNYSIERRVVIAMVSSSQKCESAICLLALCYDRVRLLIDRTKYWRFLNGFAGDGFSRRE